MDLVTFEAKSTETLEALTDYFDELVESDPKLAKADVAYSVSVFILSGQINFLQIYVTLNYFRMEC